MVVEDSPDLRLFMQAALKIDGHEMIEAADGQEGMNLLNSQEDPPDLVFVDWFMPVMSGEEFLLEREKHPHLTQIPVIVMSGKDRLDIQATNIKFIRKPVDLDALLSIIADSVGRSR